MADKFITLTCLKKFKDLLDTYYEKKFAEKGAPVEETSSGNVAEDDFATDGEVNSLIDDIFGHDFATDEEVDNLLDDIFG